jgi:hypothetical protein
MPAAVPQCCQMMAKLAHPDLHLAFPDLLSGQGEDLRWPFIAEWREAVLEGALPGR